MRTRLGLLLALSLWTCGAPPAAKKKVRVEGDVLPFTTEVAGVRVQGAKVSILEHPELTFTTGADAHFAFDGLEEGEAITLTVEHPDYKPTQTNTVTLGPDGLNPFPVQVVSTQLFELLAALMPKNPQEDHFCAIATTAARLGGGLYTALRQGIPGATVTLTPAARDDSGPFYFTEAVLPSASQPSTSIDGGLLYYRVPPGTYVMRASRAGTVFNEVTFQCRVGWVVNAGPPMGVSAHVVHPNFGAGAHQGDDAFTAATDTLCLKTAACVKEREGEDRYAPANLASCKAHFRNMWAQLDAPCAEQTGVKARAKAVFDCRAASCADTLGEDVCPAEETAFRAAEDAYGTCVKGD